MTNEEMIQIGKRIKSLRKERKLSQEEVAKQMDISRQAVTRWENGRTLPSSGHVLKLADLFGVPVESLTGGCDKDESVVAEEKPKATADRILTPEEWKAGMKAEIRRCIWAVWAFLLTILFFVICRFFDGQLGWDVYVWHYMELYCYPWTACFLVFVGGILQKKRFVASVCAGCVMTVLVGQLIALYDRSYSLLKFNESWMALIIFWNLALIAGIYFEYRAKKEPWKIRTLIWMSLVLLVFVCVSCRGFQSKYAYNRGAEDGYRAGYERGLHNAKTGEENRTEQEDEDCKEYWEKSKAGSVMWGMSRYKGFCMYWYAGYTEGRKAGINE